MSASCKHDDFAAVVRVARFEDTGRFAAEVRIACANCNEPFRFLGVPPGILWDRPSVSIDGLELSAPIEPEGEPRLFAKAIYSIPPELGPIKGNA